MEKLSSFEPEIITPESPIESHISHKDVISYLQEHLKVKNNIESLSEANIEIELEEEQRILVQPVDPSKYEGKWVDDIRDVYDGSDTIRIREKNGKLRLSIKIPLFSYDTEKTKCCIRIEIKPNTKEQEDCIFQVGNDLIQQETTKIRHKIGTPVYLTNGQKVWLDKNDQDDYWIEIDGLETQIETLLPQDIVFIRHRKNKQNKKEQEVIEEQKREFIDQFVNIVKITSRTAKGISDTSVSQQKEKTLIEGEDLVDQVNINTHDVAEYLWNLRNVEINTVDDLKNILKVSAKKINNQIGMFALRTWEVKYGRKVNPEDLPQEMENFYQQYFDKLKQVQNNELSAHELASWIEWSVDTDLHPFVDGCGRISKAWSGLVISMTGQRQPTHESREEYYKAINGDADQFKQYYLEHVKQ